MNARHSGLAPNFPGMGMRNGSSVALDPAFFARAADSVARDLLGRTLVRRISGKRMELIINETEAYLGPHDLACHAARGRTARTEVMYGPPGTLYVYFVYGLHWMLNVVTGQEGYPAAVLIRAAGDISGPARLTRALAIDAVLNGRIAAPEAGLWFEGGGSPAARVIATPRIGVAYAGPRWSSRKLRFMLGPERPSRS
jgi:DNA-3-methyladenine glycosylase